MLIQKDTKQSHLLRYLQYRLRALLIQKDTKHRFLERPLLDRFESFANSERYKTTDTPFSSVNGLRALLIQKDTKLVLVTLFTSYV